MLSGDCVALQHGYQNERVCYCAIELLSQPVHVIGGSEASRAFYTVVVGEDGSRSFKS